VKVKSKKYFSFSDFFAKIYSLLTHALKTPPLRSHYYTYILFIASAIDQNQILNAKCQLMFFWYRKEKLQPDLKKCQVFSIWFFSQ
jgi:hypothetical protein